MKFVILDWQNEILDDISVVYLTMVLSNVWIVKKLAGGVELFDGRSLTKIVI